MARITVEDCLMHVENRFSLVLIAAERTKQLLKGAEPQIDTAGDNKEVVTALREVAAGLIKYHEKDPKEVAPEVAAQELKRTVAMRQLLAEQGDEVLAADGSLPPDSGKLDSELDDAELDDLDGAFPEDDI